VDLTWTPNSDEDLGGYNVYRREGAGEFVRINNGLVKTPAFHDAQVRPAAVSLMQCPRWMLAATRVESPEKHQSVCQRNKRVIFLANKNERAYEICRISTSEGPQFGLIESIQGQEQITQTAPDGAVPVWSRSKLTKTISLEGAKFLEPVKPRQIVCVGRNYRDHAKELGNEVPAEPLTFFKPPSSLIAPGEKIVLPITVSDRIEYEGELGVIIGKECRRIGPDADCSGIHSGLHLRE